MGKQIFISYQQDDRAFAEQLIHQVQAQGFTTWIDNERQGPIEELDQAIRDACALIAIMSPTACFSECVTYDWAFAFGCGTKVIPVIYKSTPLHPRLEAIYPLDFTAQSPWDDLMKALQVAASESPAFKLL